MVDILIKYMDKAGEVATSFVDMDYMQRNPVMLGVTRELLSFGAYISNLSKRCLPSGVSYALLCGAISFLKQLDELQPKIDEYNALLEKRDAAVLAQKTGDFKVDYRGTIDEALESAREAMGRMEV